MIRKSSVQVGDFEATTIVPEYATGKAPAI